MDLTAVVSYIKLHKNKTDLSDIEGLKSWFFSLHGLINEKLSTKERHIHSADQVIKQFPNISLQVISVFEAVLRPICDRKGLPASLRTFGSFSQLLETINSAGGGDAPEKHIQRLYLCLQVLLEYVEAAGEESADETHIRGLIFIVYRGLCKMATLIGIECEEVATEVIFYAKRD